MNRAVRLVHAGGAICAAFLLCFLLLAALFLHVRTVRAEGGTWPPVGKWVGGAPYAVAVSGNVAWTASLGGALVTTDISSPSSPFRLGYYDVNSGDRWDMWLPAVAVDDHYAYLRTSLGMYVFDTADALNPTPIGCVSLVAPAVRGISKRRLTDRFSAPSGRSSPGTGGLSMPLTERK